MQYTTIQQSKRLVELGLDPKTADLSHLQFGQHNPILGYSEENAIFYNEHGDKYYPLWSLDALLRVIPCPYQMTRGRDGAVQFMLINVLRHDTFYTELEAVYTMVVWLLENDLLDETKLKNYDTERADKVCPARNP